MPRVCFRLSRNVQHRSVQRAVDRGRPRPQNVRTSRGLAGAALSATELPSQPLTVARSPLVTASGFAQRRWLSPVASPRRWEEHAFELFGCLLLHIRQNVAVDVRRERDT